MFQTISKGSSNSLEEKGTIMTSPINMQPKKPLLESFPLQAHHYQGRTAMNRSRPFVRKQPVFSMCLLVIVCPLLLFPRTALAHAVLVTSTPTANSTVAGPDVAMTFKFNSRVDATRSQISIVNASGQSKVLEIDKQQAPDTVTTHASKLGPGKYAIHWQVLSVDGHITRGQIPFEVR